MNETLCYPFSTTFCNNPSCSCRQEREFAPKGPPMSKPAGMKRYDLIVTKSYEHPDGTWVRADDPAILAAIEAMERRRAPVNGDYCECDRCRKAAELPIACETCGYIGTPLMFACCCYDYTCAGGDSRGSGCPHGSATCPVCQEGETDPWEIIRALRLALYALKGTA